MVIFYRQVVKSTALFALGVYVAREIASAELDVPTE